MYVTINMNSYCKPKVRNENIHYDCALEMQFSFHQYTDQNLAGYFDYVTVITN